jgi:hypothetical protein
MRAELISAFDATSVCRLYANPPAPIAALRDVVIEQFRRDPGGYALLFGTWPPHIGDVSSALGALLLFVATLLQRVARPLEVLDWLKVAVIPVDWHRESPADNDVLYVVSMIKTKSKLQYAMLDREQDLRLDGTNSDGREMKCVMSTKVKKVVVAGNGVKFTFDDNTMKSVPLPNPASWVVHPPFPLMLCGIEAPFPLLLLISFFNCLTGSGMIVFRAHPLRRRPIERRRTVCQRTHRHIRLSREDRQVPRHDHRNGVLQG